LVVNAVFRAQRADDPIARAMQQRGQDALAAIPKGLTEFPRTELPLAPHNLIGVAALRAMLQGTRDAPYLAKSHSSHLDVLPPTLADVIDQIAPTTHAPALTGTTVVVSQSAQGLLAPGQRRNIDHDKVARNAKMAGRAGFSVGMRRRWSVGNDCAFSSAITKPSAASQVAWLSEPCLSAGTAGKAVLRRCGHGARTLLTRNSHTSIVNRRYSISETRRRSTC
jgi:hypothetical protein